MAAAAGADEPRARASVSSFHSNLRRLLDLTVGFKDKTIITPKNAYLTTEILVGQALNARIASPLYVQFLAGIADLKEHVSVLPSIFGMMPIDGPESTDTAPTEDFMLMVKNRYASQVIEFKAMRSFAQEMFDSLPSFPATGLARLVIMPISFETDVASHANAVVVDRKHHVAVVCEPLGEATPFVRALVADVIGSEYKVSSALTDVGYQRDLNYCGTWAPFIAANIARVAILEDVPVDAASRHLQDALRTEVERLEPEHQESVPFLVSRMARALAAVSAMLELRAFGPGSTDATSVLGEIGPDIACRTPLKLLREGFTNMPDAVDVHSALIEWYRIMHTRQRCSSWKVANDDGMFALVPGFEEVIRREASETSMPVLLSGILRFDNVTGWLEQMRIDDEEASALPKAPDTELRGSYFPSAVALEVAELFGLRAHDEAHYSVFGKGAEIALRRTAAFRDLAAGISTHPNRPTLELVTKSLRHCNGALGHRWIEGQVTPRFREQWKKNPDLPEFTDFIETRPLLNAVDKYNRPLMGFVLAMVDPSTQGGSGKDEEVTSAAGGGGGAGDSESSNET